MFLELLPTLPSSDELNMTESQRNPSRPRINIDDIISDAIENAEGRRDLSESELNGIIGGASGSGAATESTAPIVGKVVHVPITVGLIARDPLESKPPIA
jgi:hypothetical protein